jgi:hypothetical protein
MTTVVSAKNVQSGQKLMLGNVETTVLAKESFGITGKMVRISVLSGETVIPLLARKYQAMTIKA